MNRIFFRFRIQPLVLMLVVAASAYVKGMAQEKTEVRGVVRDAETQQGMAGVTVAASGATVKTDSIGSYRMEVGPNAVLTFSSVGYESVEIPVNSRRVVDVMLQKSTTALDQVVVIGYGTQRKSDLTGSVGSISERTLKERPASSVNEMLAGRISGVQVNVNSGRPGGFTNVRVRGFSSINSSNDPLYVIDGVMTESMGFINPTDIVSIEILKDASSTAIYGARGANGVILITTKRGKSGFSEVNYNVDVSTPTLGPNMPKYLNAREYLQVEDIAYRNIEKYDPVGWADGKYELRNPALNRTDPRLFDSEGNPLYDTDWMDEATQHRISQNHQLGITGGSDSRSYAVSLGYRDDQGLIKTSYMKRYNGRLTFDDQVRDWLKVGGTLTYNYQTENRVDQDYLPIRMIAEGLPFLPVKYPDGSWSANRDYPYAEASLNPIQYLYERKYILNTQTALGNIYSNIRLFEGLEMRTELGTSNITQEINTSVSRGLSIMGEQGSASVNNGRTNFWSLDHYFTYNNSLSDVHSINAMLGMSWQESSAFGINVSVQNFPSDYFGFNNIGAGSNNPIYGSGASRFSFNSYFGRVNYSMFNKYLLTVTGRIDGSSKFGDNYKYAFFPSAALAWRVSDEPFLRQNEVVSNLKLRMSYGVTGNSEIPPYSSLSLLNSGYIAVLGDQRVGGTGIGRLANPDLRWEKTAQSDVGVELGLFNNRIAIEGDLYYRKTTDMLLDAPVPRSSGYATIRRNVGSMENKGIELTVNSRNIESNAFSWKTTFNISMNRNKVLSLATPSDIIGVGGVVFINPTNIIREGAPVGSFYGLIREGIWSEAEREEAAKFASYRNGLPILPGDIKYRDVNGDYAITDADRMIIGNGSPDGWGALVNEFTYRNWGLTVDLQYAYGNDVFELSMGSSEDRVALANSYRTVLNAWTPENQHSIIPELRDTRAGYVINEDTHWLKDGSFVRGRNLALSYTLPSGMTQRWGVNQLRVYASLQNFFLIVSDEVNGDPETVGTGFGAGAFSQGLTYHAYPKPTLYMLGVNVSF
ncbi:SusC/RagA family TonB-linked outer membrane protein [Parapedobacter defluvii]|nr:TonB-dependent receptor [Parapedobacter defluvii]